MKIKKTFQGELPDNRVVNAKSNSATDAYSANYLNDKLRNVVVSPTEPTTGEDVWIKRSSNILKFDNFEKTVNGVTFTMKDQVLHVEGTATAYTQECYLPINLTLEEAMTLTVDWNDDNLVPKAAYTYNGTSYYPNIYSQELEPDTHLNQLYFIIASGATVNTDVRFQLEKGRGFSGWQPVMEKAILVKNDNDVYEDLIKKSIHVGIDKPKNGEEIWIKISNNLFDTKKLVNSGWNNTGNSKRVVWGINVKAGVTYTITNYSQRNVSVFETQNLIQNSENNSVLVEHGTISGIGNITITTKNSAYLRLQFSNSDNSDISVNDILPSDIQIEIGDTSTKFEPFTPKKIYTKNDNEIYEEFYNEEYLLKDTIFSGTLFVTDGDVPLKGAKRFLDVYFTMLNDAGAQIGKFTIDTSVADKTFGSVVLTCHDVTNMVEYYVCECSYVKSTNIFNFVRTGFINVATGKFEHRYSGAYHVYRIDTYD